MAWPMSPSRAPGFTCGQAAHHALVGDVDQPPRARARPRRRRTCGEVSPCQPSTITVTSMLAMSPSRSGRSPGMPWQTTWLGEMQTRLGVALVEQAGGQGAVVEDELARQRVELRRWRRRGPRAGSACPGTRRPAGRRGACPRSPPARVDLDLAGARLALPARRRRRPSLRSSGPYVATLARNFNRGCARRSVLADGPGSGERGDGTTDHSGGDRGRLGRRRELRARRRPAEEPERGRGGRRYRLPGRERRHASR